MNKITFSLVSIVALSHLTYAGGAIVPVEVSIVEIEESNWEFRLSPYGWFAGFEGDVATIPGLDPAHMEISSSDALSDTEASLALIFEGKKEQHGFIIDFLYSDMRTYNPLAEGFDLSLDTISKTTLFSGAYLYEVYQGDKSVIDAYIGARYWKIDTTLAFSGGLGILAGKSINHAESWVDPLIGIKGRTLLGDTKFYLTGAATVGGFGVGSDLFYDLNANIGYQWSESIGTTIGYRMYDLDYENDGFVYDVKQQGWMIGLNWAF